MKYALKLFAALLLWTSLLGSCSDKKASTDEAKSTLESSLKNPKAIVLDVRNKDKFETSHVPGAMLIPLGELESKVETLIADKSTPLIVHCAKGGRSARATTLLSTLGYESIVDAKTPDTVAQAKGVTLVSGP